MPRKTAQILWFEEVSKNSISLVGGKGANLGEMYRSGIPVPNGFCVTAYAYFEFLKKTSLRQKILTELSGLDTQDSKKLIEASKNIKTAILAAQMPKDLAKLIAEAYHELSGEFDKRVAVRSSATAEDLPDASFAGQQETYLNIQGAKDVIKSVQKCWASLFEARAIFYRTENKFNHMKVGIAVPIQLMVQSEVSGIMFTVNPITNSSSEVSIEAAYGLGQPIVSGEITPDQFIVSKETGKITKKQIVKQTWQLTDAGEVKVSKAYQEKQKLDDKHVIELAKLGMKVEKHYGRPQDMEWGYQDKTLYIVQSRPVTTLKMGGNVVGEIKISDEKNAKLLLEGLGASPGAVSGPVRIIKSSGEITKIQPGDILVAEMTNPDYVPAMKRAAAILTDKGGRTSHAAIVSRELGIPAVVGAGEATKILQDGEIISVDGSNGKVFEGNIVVALSKKESISSISEESIKTATKVYLNLAEPELADLHAKRNVDGIGLLRAEFMIAHMGTHPRKFVQEGRQKEFINHMAKGLETFAKAFHPRPVVYRTTDFRTNEYRNLKGGAQFETEEPNPMIGFRGVSRYLDDADVFKMEIEAIKIVRNKKGYKNLYVMLPFVRTVEQLREVKKLMASFGLRRSSNFKLWMMVEIPSNVISLEEFLDEGVDGVSVGTNDLTMLILGVDRDNEKVISVYNELDPAMLWCLEKVITTAKKYKVTSSICGQAPSEYPDLVKKLVGWGMTSVSISPDVIDKTRKIIYDAEQGLLKRKSKK
ncbi:phosphoenolpyruvate synthase [candidate division WWE3 bacterium RIFCSPHIGHO2_01_FULL_42_13]|uniref:Phosphoenolpyruvate synthase n=1 Tax=candidate division WWE3 bacterium RIFCSPHIGHO2_01_FULL_42_13 TaxID=1802617 RepID=A0A1F4UQF5_UNCKA|nr:MAG: phosphoenolpyruvate synthase [candidate division WWE3 bacterium RIFCSPHIGHO2_01_FULL_42_13]